MLVLRRNTTNLVTCWGVQLPTSHLILDQGGLLRSEILFSWNEH